MIFKLEPFKKGKPNTLLNADNAEVIRKFMEAFQNIEILEGKANKIDISERNVKITLKPSSDLNAVIEPLTLYLAGGSVGVRWGLVENIVPTGIDTFYPSDGTRYFWVDITMKTTSPWNVISASIKQSTGGYPAAEEPDPETGNPPSKIYFPLGIIDGGELNNTGTGSIGVYLYTASYFCRAANPGDPNATPPVPAEEGGIVNVKNWASYRK